ncbi:MAG: FHA domain-containing protein [Vicinamibacteria bacterium]
MRLRFGQCVLDTDRRQLSRSGRAAALTPKAFRLLEVLAAHRPNAVSRAELREAIWPDMPVGGTTIARLLSEVRAAIDSPPPAESFVRTIHRFGYAFAGAALEEPEPDAGTPSGCAVQGGGPLAARRPGANVIARAADAAVHIALGEISRRHARILVEGERALVEDLGSKHGTLVADRRIEGPVELKHGDHIGVGPVLLVFRRASAGDESTF